MADLRRQADLPYGHPGRLTFIPRSLNQYEPVLLHTTRRTADVPYFRAVESSAELYPASKAAEPSVPTEQWHERRQQERWLQQAHPDALMGGSLVHDILKEEVRRFDKTEPANAGISTGPLLASGQISDVRDPSAGVKGLRALAMATGESGELLRLMRFHHTQWKWDGDYSDLLHLAVVETEDSEDELIWASDGLPITKIEFATSLTNHEPVRWVVVQKETSTTVLQPEYHTSQVAENRPTDDFNGTPSCMKASPIFALSHQETGGNAHVDVAFNPGAGVGRPPQLIIMDECGSWTIWEVQGTWRIGAHTLRPLLVSRGNVWDGYLHEVPTPQRPSADTHRILPVGNLHSPGKASIQSSGSDAFGASIRSRLFLMWHPNQFRMFDAEQGVFLPDLQGLATSRDRPDPITDAKVSPVDRDHVFVLTSKFIFWISVGTRISKKRGAVFSPRVLLCCANVGSGYKRGRLSLTRSSMGGEDTTLAVTYEAESSQLRVFWFSFSAETRLPHWHAHAVDLPEAAQPDSGLQHQLLDLMPARLESSLEAPATNSSSRYVGKVEFFQCSILNEDLSVQYCIFASSKDPLLDITLPQIQIGATYRDKHKRWRKKRRLVLQRMQKVFMLPDGMGDPTLAVSGQQRSRGSRALKQGEDKSIPQPVYIKFDRVCHFVQAILDAPNPARRATTSSQVIHALQRAIKQGFATGSLPLTTCREVLQDASLELALLDEVDGDGGDLLSKIVGLSYGDVTIPSLTRASLKASEASYANLGACRDQLSTLSVCSEHASFSELAQQIRKQWLEELAVDLFTSSIGVVIEDTPLYKEVAEPAERGHGSRGSSRLPSSSPIKSRSQMPVSFGLSSDAAIQRLGLLAPSIDAGNLGGSKQASVLSYWPAERGTDTSDYVSSVAIATDSKFDEAKQRLQKIEERRRKAQADKVKRQNFAKSVPQSSPGMGPGTGQGVVRDTQRTASRPSEAMSSQQGPMSSQTMAPPVTMSQPVAGVFGDRKKAKKGKPKRKMGFR